MSAHTNARLIRAGHRILTTEDGAAVFQAFAGAVGPAEAAANEERLILVWSAHDGLVDAVRSAMAAAKARQAGGLVNFDLLAAEMFAALDAAGVDL